MKKNSKKGLALWVAVLALLTLLSAASAGAESYTPEEYLTFDPATGTITGYDPAGGDAVSIPPTIGGVAVTAIGSHAFEYKDSITSVVIPEGVTGIGDSAFSECYSLGCITLPSTLTSIGNNAFLACMSLSSVNFPNGLTSIGSYAFASCYSLSGSIVLPDSARSIGDGAFMECYYITGINIPEGITGIGNNIFTNCANLRSVSLPSTLTSIGNGSFASCNNLVSIIIPGSVTSIGDGAFSSSGLTSLSLPDGLETIGDSAFNNCQGLSSIAVPDSVTSIGENAFGACSNLVSITLPAGITSIADYTFDACNRLNGITIPASVTSIGDCSFKSCWALNSITIPAGVTSIGAAAFQECSYLTSVTIPASVTYIGVWAFYNCSQLTGVYFLGDAPEVEYIAPEFDIFVSTSGGLKVYYPYGTSGWTNPWHGRETVARCTVTYDSWGGSAVASATVNAGGLLTQPAAPTKGGAPFVGWYREASLETTWNFTSDTVTQNITLYAKWNTIPTRKAGIPATATASVTVNTAYTLNLATIFEDADADPLTYKVSVNGASDIGANASYTYTPSSAGNTTLVFKANDGTADSADTYTVTLAAANAFTVTGGELGTDYTHAGSTLTFLRPGSFGVSMQSGVTSTTIEKIVVNATGSSAASPVNITLNGVDIRLSSGFPFDIQGSSHVNLTLTGTNVLTTSGNYCAGLHVPVDAALTIGGTGSLTAAGGLYGAGIGGDGDYGTCGTVTISSGTVNATGGSGGAGIGSGAYSGNSGTVTISGGSVAAMGGGDAAGIGGGFDGNGSTVLISGGTVTATGGNFGAGIGGGRGYDNGCGNGGTVTISGGTVTAVGGICGAGIGGGDRGSGGTVTMTGGVVFAEGKNGGKDIGAGYTGSGGSLNLSGTAALFLYNDDCVAPTTATHTHQAVTGPVSDVYGIPVSTGWTGNIGAYLRIYTLSYDVNNGSGTVPAPSTQRYNTASAVSDGSSLSRANYAFTGWNTAADGSDAAYAVGSTFTFSANTILYAQWNAIPQRQTDVPATATAEVTVNTAHTLDLTAIFADAENDPLSYTVVVGSNPGVAAVANYSYRPTELGETTLVFTANDGWADSADSYTLTLTALRATRLVTLSAQPVAGGTVSGGGSYDEGTAVMVTATPNEGYDFVNWSENGTAVSSDADYAFALGDSDRQLVANFVLSRPLVSVTSAGNGSVSGGGRYPLGSSVSLGAAPDAGYNFAGWYEGSTKVSALPNYSFTVTRDIELTAQFAAMPSADLGVATLGGGSVRLNGDSVALDENYLEQHSCGANLTLTATPDSGYSFAYWQDAVSGSLLSTEPVYQTVIGAGISLKAVFNRVPDAGSSEFTVVFLNKSGRILQSTKVAKGTAATAPAEPSLAGYRFDGWDQALGPVTTNLTVRARYQRLDYLYHLSVAGGTLSTGGAGGDFFYDWPVTVVADPAPSGQQFSHWLQDGVKVSTASSYSFFTPLRDTTLTAVFVADTSELPTLPFITLSNDVQVDVAGGSLLFVASRNLPPGYSLVESGILLLQAVSAPSELTLGTAGVLCGKIKNDSTDQFYVRKTNVAPGATWHARAYLIYRDGDGNIVTVYSENTVSRTLN